MSGWYDISTKADGQCSFVLKAGNAEVILSSERYTTRAAAENGIASVRANSADDARYERVLYLHMAALARSLHGPRTASIRPEMPKPHAD